MSRGPIVVVAGTEMPNDLAVERERLATTGAELVDGRRLPADALDRVLAQASALLTEGFMPLDAAALRRLTQCEVIGFYSIGVEKIDLEAASALDIMVTNAPGYCTDEVADHAMMLLLAVGRKLRAATRIAAAERWVIDTLRPVEGLRGRTLGLVGYGGIARALGARARAFGMQVVAYDPYVRPEDIPAAEATMVELDALFRASHAVSIHLPLTPQTQGIVSRERLGLLREGAVLVNTSRGGVIDEEALLEALENGRLTGAGLDVLASEPATEATSRRLLALDNVICTPHMGYYSEDALRNVRAIAAGAVAEVLGGGLPDERCWLNRTRMAGRSAPAGGGTRTSAETARRSRP